MTSTGFVTTVAREYVAYGLAGNKRLDTIRIRAGVHTRPPKGLVAVCIHRVRFDYRPVVEDPGQLGWKVFRKLPNWRSAKQHDRLAVEQGCLTGRIPRWELV